MSQSGKITKGRILLCVVLDGFKKYTVKLFMFTKSSLLLSKMCCLQILGILPELGMFI